MALTYKVLFPFISTFETSPTPESNKSEVLKICFIFSIYDIRGNIKPYTIGPLSNPDNRLSLFEDKN